MQETCNIRDKRRQLYTTAFHVRDKRRQFHAAHGALDSRSRKKRAPCGKHQKAFLEAVRVDGLPRKSHSSELIAGRERRGWREEEEEP